METIKHFFKTHPHAWWGAFLPVYLIMFFTIEHFITENYWSTQMAIDNYIPFCEYFAVFYVTWSPILAAVGVYLIIKDGEGFRRYMWMLMVTFTLSTIICILVPNGQDLRPAVLAHDNIFTKAVLYTYSIDTNTNVLPSVHVLGVMAAVFAIWKTPGLKKWGWRVGSILWGLLVTASTLLIKQHAFIDIVAALLVGLLGYVVVYILIGRRRDQKITTS
ncbi:MAG: phosphatase PAP2 family protein [Eubacteriales bacterium]|nr:phosphatase PAP2 family protein [Eubacteriales bacterium]